MVVSNEMRYGLTYGARAVQLQLYMWSGVRRMYLERHDFYAEQVRVRVFAQFHDIEDEAERHADAEYDRLGSLPGDETTDMADVADWANDRAHKFYGLLSDLRKQMLLGGLAGLYHQWDKDLRDFIELELRHYVKSEYAAKIAWDPNVGNVFDLLAQFGWDCRSAIFFPKINACRLVVNVYKHGKGRSLEELAANYPEYLEQPFPGIDTPPFARNMLHHDRLAVSEIAFKEMAAALRRFWEEFPERLFLNAD